MTPNSSILIVDDDSRGRDTLEALLIGEGYELQFADDGARALTAIGTRPPDLVLLDVMMPGMDGFEVCRRVRAQPASREIPIILVTALDDRESRLRGLEAGADDFVSKPFDRIELRARVRTTTRLNRYRCLLAERSKFEWVTAQSGDAIVLLDADNQIVYANPRAQLYLGVPEDTANSGTLSFVDCVQRDYRIHPENAWRLAGTSDGKAPFYLVRPETTGARAFWLRVEALHLPGGNGQTRLVQLRDVTEEMTARREIDTFHTLISHKMRTPLNHLSGGLELLEAALHHGDTEELSQWLRMARRAAARLIAHVEQIMRYVEGPVSAEPGGGMPLGCLETAVLQASRTVDCAARVDICLDPGERTLALSSEAFEVILIEILGNAKKFHPSDSPSVTVTAHEEDAGRICLRMQDDGVVLSPAQIARAWAPYFQAEKFLTGEVPGLGLGLATVASTVWAVGGTCRLASGQNGPGVMVELVLPVV